MNRILLFLWAGVLITCVSCGRRSSKDEGGSALVMRTMASDFSAIDVKAPVSLQVHIEPGSLGKIKLMGAKRALDKITTEVKDHRLVIGTRRSASLSLYHKPDVEVTLSDLSALSIQGSADAVIDGPLTATDFLLTISGAGDVTIKKINVNQFSVQISGSGNVNVESGTAVQATYSISGAGNVNSFDMRAANVKATLSGTGNIEVFASQNLDANVSGAGTIQYKGGAQVKSKTSGLGSVESVN